MGTEHYLIGNLVEIYKGTLIYVPENRPYRQDMTFICEGIIRDKDVRNELARLLDGEIKTETINGAFITGIYTKASRYKIKSCITRTINKLFGNPSKAPKITIPKEEY